MKDIFINKEVMKFVEKGRFLGLFFDHKLNFSNHVQHIRSKISKILGIFYKVPKYVPLPVHVILCFSLFYPYFIYSNRIW